MKRAMFCAWMAMWVAMCCYGFRIMPHGLAAAFDASWSIMTAGTLIPVLADFRPGALGLGPISLIAGGFLSIWLYFWAFPRPEQQEEEGGCVTRH
ncbi:TPA: hypothetical protein ACYLN4_000591 [Burkholderia lata]